MTPPPFLRNRLETLKKHAYNMLGTDHTMYLCAEDLIFINLPNSPVKCDLISQMKKEDLRDGGTSLTTGGRSGRPK